jgi:hypothetical protein
MTEQTKFEEWAIVDVMGHQRFVGRVFEQVIAGQGFVRVDIPAVEGVQAWTKLIGPSSIYAITPVSEDVARAMAAKRKSIPIAAFDFTRETMRAGTKHLPFQEEDDPYDDESYLDAREDG